MCTATGAANACWQQLKRERKEEIIIATKAGRRLDLHNSAGYNRPNLTAFIERSLKNLDTRKTLDLVQLHCPPTEGITAEQGSAGWMSWLEAG